MEFGLLAPVLVVFLMGMVDLARAIVTLRRLNAVVQQIGLMATALSVQPDQTTTLTVSQLNQASSVIYAVFPALLSQAVYNATTNPVPVYAVVASDVVFTPTSSTCQPGLTCTSYTANLAWSVPLRYGQQIQRSCGAVTQTTATAITAALTSMLVVDVVYDFTPFFGRFLGTLTLRQTAYFNQRSIAATYITYNTASASSGGVICAGYT
jgi:Flp pilus assembly protein TadG